MSKLLAPRSVLLIVVGLVAAIVCWFAFDGEAPPTVALDRSAAVEEGAVPRAPTAVDLAESPSPKPDASAVAITDTHVDSARSSVGGSLEGRTWSDLIVAVDRTSGAPVDGAHLAIVDADGELRRARLDEHVLATDLASGVLLALDTPSHVPRFFFAEHLANHVGAPRTVALHPSGALRFSAHGDEALPKFDVRVLLADPERATELDAHLIAAGVDNEAREPFYTLGNSLRHLLDPANDARGRKRQVRWLVRTEALHVAFTPDGPPTPAGWSNVFVADVSSLPVVIDDLVGDVDVRFEVMPANALPTEDLPTEIGVSLFAWRRRGESEWRNASVFSGQLPIAEYEVVDLELRRMEPATLRGTLPSGSSAARAFFMHVVESGRFSFMGEEPLPTDRQFALTGLVPGRNVVTLHWRAADGAFATREFDVSLAPGEDRDLGHIDVAADACELVIASALVVDGELDTTALGGRLTSFEFGVHLVAHQAREGNSGGRRSFAPLRLHGPGDVVIRGLVAGTHGVQPLAPLLPDDILRSFQLNEPPNGRDVLVGASLTRVELHFGLTSAFEHTFQLNVPAAVAGSQLELEAWAFEVDGERELGREYEVDLVNDHVRDGEARAVEGRATLPAGDWFVVAVARPSWKGGGSGTLEPRDGLVLQSFVGSTAFTAKASGTRVVVDLALAAVARRRAESASEEEPESSSRSVPIVSGALRPLDLPTAACRMWPVEDEWNRPMSTLWCLFPNTEHVNYSGLPLFHTGQAASVIEVDLR